MKKILTKGRVAGLIIAAVLVIDQLIKVWVKTHMLRYESIRITDWFYIYFTENNGMAFGVELFAKLFLTTFRIAAVAAIVWYLVRVIRQNYKMGYIVCLALIVAGAAGNIIDSVFYGEIFSESTYSQLAHFVPVGEGYSSWCYGKVVDMFYFPLVEWNWPDWLPLIGGNHFIFFSPIFNFADASISVGVFCLVFFYKKLFK
jgi:signal peptidase II